MLINVLLRAIDDDNIHSVTLTTKVNLTTTI